MDLEQRFYHYGLGLGLPYGALNSVANTFDTMRYAGELSHRRNLACKMLENSPWTGFIPKETGYARVEPNTLPGTVEMLEVVSEIIRERRNSVRSEQNTPYFRLERPRDFRDYPELTDFVLSDALIHIVSDYYGMVPQLKGFGIWLTPRQERQFSSQLYHLDKPEARIVGLFLNLKTNGEDSGPLTLLPADISRKVRRKTNYESVYFRGDGRLPDGDVFAHCAKKDEISLGGHAGTGGFADTSNCFHFGSRCRVEERQMLVVKFMLPHKARNPRTEIFDLVPKPKDEVRQLVLSGVEFRPPHD